MKKSITVNEDTIKGKWLEVKGDLQKAWGKLTDDDLEKSKGDFKSISGLIQQRYGEVQGKTSEKLKKILSRLQTEREAVVKKVKQSIKDN